MSYIPPKANDLIQGGKLEEFFLIESFAWSKRNVISRAISTSGCTDEIMNKLKDVQSKPFTFIFELMDECKVREVAESNSRYWEYDEGLKKYDYLPEDYVIREKKESECQASDIQQAIMLNIEEQIISPLDRFIIVAKDRDLWAKVTRRYSSLPSRMSMANNFLVLGDILDELYDESLEFEQEDLCYFMLFEDGKIYLKNVYNGRVHREIDEESCQDILGYVVLGCKDNFESVWSMIAEEGHYRFR